MDHGFKSQDRPQFAGRDGQETRFEPESYLAIFNALREAVLIVDTDQTVIAVNRAATELLACGVRDCLGRHICDLLSDEPCPSDLLDETIRGGEAINDFQTPIRLGDGMPGQVIIRTVPLRELDGSPAGVALLLRDVTEVTALRKEVTQRYRMGRIIGKDRKMQRLYRLIADVAASDASVLVRGESGTGKELVARAIHFAGARAGGPFVEVNCSALSESLLESELFGHVKGAFTGAVSSRRGRFEEARSGTIFLDEIGDVNPAVQVKLLRVLQERVIERVGDNRPVPVDVRVISATNRDLEGLLAAGRLREDFYYRIKVVSLVVPPLRERREDIPLLIAHFLARLRGRALPEGDAVAATVSPADMSGETMRLLMRHSWPGNVRELDNALEHANVLSRGGVILPEHLPPEITGTMDRTALQEVPRHTDREKEVIAEALARAGWNRSRAARRLGVDRTTLWRKIKEYGLRPDD